MDVIVNITARRHAAEPDLLARMRRAADGRAAIHPTSSLAELERVATSLARDGASFVVVSGGDGTFMATTTALARAFGEERMPRLAFLPGGTVATVARAFGRRGDPADHLAAIVAREDRLEFELRPSLSVVERSGDETTKRVGFIFGTGLVAKFFDVYYASGARGTSGSARIVARIFVESFFGGPLASRVLTPLPCTIEVDGRALAPRAFSLVCSSVVRDLGIGMKVTYRGAEDPRRPHLVASSLPPRDLGPRVFRVLAGVAIGGRDHFDDLVSSFRVRFPGEGGPYVLDGEVLRAREVEVSAGPLLRVARPS